MTAIILSFVPDIRYTKHYINIHTHTYIYIISPNDHSKSHLGRLLSLFSSVGGRVGSRQRMSLRKVVNGPKSCSYTYICGKTRIWSQICVCRAQGVDRHARCSPTHTHSFVQKPVAPWKLAQPFLLFLLRSQLLEKLLDCEQFIEFHRQKLPMKSKVFPKIDTHPPQKKKELEGSVLVPKLEKELLKQVYIYVNFPSESEKRDGFVPCSLPGTYNSAWHRVSAQKTLLNKWAGSH